MAGQALREARGAAGEATLTPLIDITFLVLIFFLVGMKVRANEGRIDAFLPRDRGLSTPPVQIVGDPRIAIRWVDPATGRETRGEHGRARLSLDRVALADRAGGPDFGALAQRLEALRRERGRRPHDPLEVILDARPAVPWRYVVSALDACARAGVPDVSFAAAEAPGADDAAGP